MPTYTVQTTDIITTSSCYSTLADGDTLLLMDGVTMLSSVNGVYTAISAYEDTVFNLFGNLLNDQTYALVLLSTAESSDVFIGSTGFVSGGAGQIYLSAISLDGLGSSLTNQGTIQGNSSYGVASVGDQITIHNSGLISGAGGVHLGRSGAVENVLTNAGTIMALGGSTFSSRYQNGICIEGDGAQVINQAGGVIMAQGATGSGIAFYNTGGFGGADSSISNYGEITSVHSYGVSYDYLLNGTASLVNFGLISGGTGSFLGNAFGNDVQNFGTMQGAADFTEGDNGFVNAGLVLGDVLFGDGNDFFDNSQGQVAVGSEIWLGGGDDEFIGGQIRDRVYDGAGDDTVEGNGGNDSFRAGSGANHYDGGDGFDYLSYYDFSTWVRIDLANGSTAGGGAGNAASNDSFINIEAIGGTNSGGDYLYGNAERNTLYGWGGDDHLYGRGGNDRLLGGEGDDFFDGGDGTDQLYGGAGADQFEFDRGEGDDVIHDFENNIDTLRFDNFSYLTTAADALTYATQVGNDVLFDFGADGTVLVLGVTTGQLANDIDIV